MINEKNVGGAQGRRDRFVGFIGESGEIGNQPPLSKSMAYGGLDIAREAQWFDLVTDADHPLDDLVEIPLMDDDTPHWLAVAAWGFIFTLALLPGALLLWWLL